MSKLTELTAKLSEILQIDRPDLDFGIYRVINARADEIKDYLARRLPERVKAALGEGGQANLEALKPKLADAIAGAQAAGFNPDDSPKVKELRQQIEAAAGSAVEYENAVYSHLLTFFSRYYDQGDFISQRRYKGDTYAIPYAGEEVVLHWANKDQYYTKSGEAFSNYSFRLEDGRLVHFRLIAADTAKDNRKDNDKERRFVLIEPMTVTRVDDDGETIDEVLTPVAEEDGALVLRFAYQPMPQGTKQAELLTRAIETVLADAAVKARWQDLTRRAPTEKSPLRTVLEKHLTDYTAKNTADYFIHKDLGGFLRRELDFYIKNEVMNLDDVQNAAAFAAIETQLRTIQTLRSIALDLIAFLAQLEDFQKRLWWKKKFIVASHYCLTIDRVPKKLWPAVAANTNQWSQWRELGLWTGADASEEVFSTNRSLMVDTALYSASFKADLLRDIPDLEASIEGLIVHGDNFQGLSLLARTYQKKIRCTYIDPPYNSPSSEIAYKNSYKHSSWLSLMEGRLRRANRLRSDDGSIVVAIDKYEQNALERMLIDLFPSEKIVNIPVEHNKKGVQGDGFSFTNEFAVFVTPALKGAVSKYELPKDQWEYSNLRNWGGESLRTDGRTCFYPIYVKDRKIIGYGDVCDDNEHPASANVRQADGSIAIYPIDAQGVERKWRYAFDTVKGIHDLLRVEVARNGDLQIMKAQSEASYKTMWYDSRYNAGDNGTRVLTEMGFLPGLFDFPKSIHLVRDCVNAVALKSSIILDYFAGSGTTAHSVMALNRADGGTRRYIMIEQGEYFDTVLKPRIQKVIYSAEWRGGRPVSQDTGISHGFKVLKIESYEDTLNNLALTRTGEQTSLLDNLAPAVRDDYLLRYMMDVEARGSLLSVADFRKPFDYKLQVAVDSAGAAEERPVDLIETFNYLVGLTVKTIDLDLERGFAMVRGVLPDRQTALILWRDCDKLDYEGLLKLCDKLAINPADSEHDVVYVNGDHTIPTVATADDAAGGETKVLKLRQIEPAFLDAMFSMDEAS